MSPIKKKIWGEGGKEERRRERGREHIHMGQNVNNW